VLLWCHGKLDLKVGFAARKYSRIRNPSRRRALVKAQSCALEKFSKKNFSKPWNLLRSGTYIIGRTKTGFSKTRAASTFLRCFLRRRLLKVTAQQRVNHSESASQKNKKFFCEKA
jgi:hypothetical protein